MSSEKTQEVVKIITRLKQFYRLKTDTQLAEKLGVSQSTLANWKIRDSIPTSVIIAKCDDIDLNYLFRGEQILPQDQQKAGRLIRIVTEPESEPMARVTEVYGAYDYRKDERKMQELEERVKDLTARLEQTESLFMKTLAILKPKEKPEEVHA